MPRFSLALSASAADAKTYTFTTIDAPGGPAVFGTTVNDINNHGQAAGYYISLGPFGPQYHAFTVRTDGKSFSTVDQPGTTFNAISGINDAGQTVGVSAPFAPFGRGFVRDASGGYIAVDPASAGLPALYSEAAGINQAGKTIVGFYADTIPSDLSLVQRYEHGFIYSGGAYTQIDVPTALGFGTQLISINGSGVISGNFLDNGPYSLEHGFLYTPGVGFSVIDGPGAFATELGKVNDLGAAVGAGLTPNPFSLQGFDASGFLLSKGKYQPIAVPGAFSTQPFGLNDHGGIVGLYEDATGIHGFIAAPVPEAASTALLLAGVGALAGVRRRSR